MIIAMSSLTKSLVFKMVLVRPFSNSSDFMRVLEKLRFRDGVWTIGLTGEVRRRFYIPLGWYGRGLNLYIVKDPSNS